MSFFIKSFCADLIFTGAQDIKNINIKKMEALHKGLYILSTPIGNLGDISSRAVKVLRDVDLIICENPIHSLKLLNNLGIKKKLFSLHDYNESALIKRIEKFQNNSAIALISDAGSPLISDPGYNLVNDYIKKELKITTVPGPSSIISALQLSGLPLNKFSFFGFAPKNKSGLDIVIKDIELTTNTSVYFISGLRLISFLNFLSVKNINRSIAVCKEITKKNEMVFRGDIKKIIENISFNKNNLRGEFVIVIAGIDKKTTKKKLDGDISLQISKLLKKFSLTEVVEIVHKLSDISKKEIYKTALLIKND